VHDDDAKVQHVGDFEAPSPEVARMLALGFGKKFPVGAMLRAEKIEESTDEE
jgi:hypothetical protein